MDTRYTSNNSKSYSSTINTLKKLSKYIKRYRGELTLGIVALIVTDILGLFPPWLIKCAIDSLPEIETTKILIKYASLVVGTVIVQGVFRFYWRKHLFGLSRKIEYDLRNDYFRHLQHLSPSFFQRTKTGDLMSRATNDLSAVREFIGLGALLMVDTVVTISTCLTLMFVLNPRLTVIALFPMLAVCLIVARFGRLIRHHFTDVQAQLSKISAMVQENITGIRVIQAYVREDHEKGRFGALNKEYITKNLRLIKVSGALYPSLTFMAGIAAVTALWLGCRDVIGGEMTLGSFVAFNGYLAMLTWPMMAMGFIINLTQRGSASMTRIEEILNIKPEICDIHPITPPSVVRNDEAEVAQTFKPIIGGEIEFKDVSFSYPETSVDAISNINLKIEAGSTIAIVGPVGSGKSTIGKLLMRFYDLHNGSITIDGIDIKRIPLNALRNTVCYVDQDPFLFSDTLYKNIAFGANDSRLRLKEDGLEKKIWDAAVMAGLERDIKTFPDNIHTHLGERGVTLSGGQKQRVALARALMRGSRILILDDTFSSLDTKTEDEIFSKIKDLIHDTTTILIAHRISKVKDADTIIALDNGKIVENGPHEKLLDMGGLYYNIYKHQTLEVEL